MMNKVGEHGGSIAAKGAIGFGTSYLLAKHCHGKKDAMKIPVAVAAVGKGLPALIALFGGDVGGPAGMALGAFDAAGQGAVDFLGVIHGLRAARKEKGVKGILVPASADVKTLPAGNFADAVLVGDEAVLGGLGVAQPGASMSLDKLREIQSYR